MKANPALKSNLEFYLLNVSSPHRSRQWGIGHWHMAIRKNEEMPTLLSSIQDCYCSGMEASNLRALPSRRAATSSSVKR